MRRSCSTGHSGPESSPSPLPPPALPAPPSPSSPAAPPCAERADARRSGGEDGSLLGRALVLCRGQRLLEPDHLAVARPVGPPAPGQAADQIQPAAGFVGLRYWPERGEMVVVVTDFTQQGVPAHQ